MKNSDIKKLGSILARLERELGGDIPEEYLIDGLCKEFGWFDKNTMKGIIAEAKRIKDEKGKSK